MDAAAKSRHADRVGETPGKYWDHNECRWVHYEAVRDEPLVPAQLSVDQLDTDEVTAVETPL